MSAPHSDDESTRPARGRADESSAQFRMRGPHGEDDAARNALRELRVQRPVDDLVQRLDQDDGPQWFQACLRLEPFDHFPLGGASLLAAPSDLNSLRQLKDQSKKLHQRGVQQGSFELQQRGLLGYFLGVGAALVQQRASLSSLPRSELRDGLLELASALPQEWAELCERATEVDDARPG